MNPIYSSPTPPVKHHGGNSREFCLPGKEKFPQDRDRSRGPSPAQLRALRASAARPCRETLLRGFLFGFGFFFVFVFGDTEIPRGDPAGTPQIRPLPSGPPHLAEPAAPLSSGGSARVSGTGVTGTSGAGHAGSCSSDIAVAQGAIPGTRRAEGMGMLIPGKRGIRRDLLDLHQSLTS